MTTTARDRNLRYALRVFGIILIFGLYPLTLLWPSGWSWHQGPSDYLGMIIAVYASLGVFLLIASRQPQQHLSLIAFTIWSSIVHAVVMAVQAIINPVHLAHFFGDIPALIIVAVVLGWLCPEAFKFKFSRQGE